MGVYRQVPSDTDDTAMFGYLQVIIPEKSIGRRFQYCGQEDPLPQNVSFWKTVLLISFLLEFDKLGITTTLQVEVDSVWAMRRLPAAWKR